MDDMRDAERFARWCASRRGLLAGAGAVGVVGLLAACGDSGGGPDRGGSGSGGTGSGDRGDAAPGAVLVAAADVPVGGGTVAGGVLVVQPVEGEFKAYDAACPHQGVQVGAPEGGVITCPAHNSTFSAADGSRQGGPAPRGLTEIPVRLDGANVVRG